MQIIYVKSNSPYSYYLMLYVYITLRHFTILNSMHEYNILRSFIYIILNQLEHKHQYIYIFIFLTVFILSNQFGIEIFIRTISHMQFYVLILLVYYNIIIQCKCYLFLYNNEINSPPTRKMFYQL